MVVARRPGGPGGAPSRDNTSPGCAVTGGGPGGERGKGGRLDGGLVVAQPRVNVKSPQNAEVHHQLFEFLVGCKINIKIKYINIHKNIYI